jgi:hypothetical protein
MTEPAPAKAPEPAKDDGAGAKMASEQATRLSAALEKVRGRTDLTAKGLATVGTAAVTAIGYTKFADVFPYDGNQWLALVGLGAGALLMVVAVIVAVTRFSGAGETVITTPDIDETVELNECDNDERKLVERVYERTARLNGARSLRAYQLRGHRFDRLAEWADDPTAANLRARAERIGAEVVATEIQASLYVVRKRAVKAVFGWGALFSIAAFIAGWYALALSADALESERTDQTAVARSCAEAREKPTIVESKLPDICGAPPAPASEPTAGSIVDGSVTAIATKREECLARAAAAEENRSVCAPLTRALQSAIADE